MAVKHLRIPVFTDDPGWHGKRLEEAFASHGIEVVFVSLRECGLGLTDSGASLFIPGFNQIPAGVFVRGVPGGSVQQVIQRLNILHVLRMQNVLVYNDGRAVERTVDKAMTSFLLHRSGVPTPATWVCESRQQAMRIVADEHTQGHQVVIKPLFGSQGMGVRRLDAGSVLPVPMEQHVEGVYYLQRYVDSGEGAWHDYRVFVINGKAVAAMVRRGTSWINNVALGGRCEAQLPVGEVAALAQAAANAVDINYCGVDLIRDRNGKIYVLEVNSIPAWRGLQGVTHLDIAQCLVDDFVARLQGAGAQAAGMRHGE